MGKWAVVLLLMVVSGKLFATSSDWQFKNASWVNDNYYGLYRLSADGNSALIVSSSNVNSIQIKVILQESTLRLVDDKAPFIVKGTIYFDDKKYLATSLKNDVNVYHFKGQQYNFADDIFDADFYEAMQYGKVFRFDYSGKDGRKYSVVIPLGNYYEKFNQYITYRRKEFIPVFLSSLQKKKYLATVSQCVDLAEAQVDDIKAKNKGISLEERQRTVAGKDAANKDSQSRQRLNQRVEAAYSYFGDTAHPSWLLYSLFGDCFNAHVAELN